MRFGNCIYAWDHGGKIEVGPHPDKDGWSDKYTYTAGACYLASKNWSDRSKQLQIFIDFMHIVVRDKVNPQDVHRAFLLIDEYREALAEDVDIKQLAKEKL